MSAELPAEIAALIGCAVTTGMGAVVNTAQVQAGSSVAVFGCGGVGLSVIQAARLVGAGPVLAIDPLPGRRESALDVGADEAWPGDASTLAAIRRQTGGRGADYVFEAVGLPKVQQECLAAARPGGTVIFAGLAPMGSETNLPGALITRQQKRIQGSYYGSADVRRDFPRFADWHLSGQVDLGRLITGTFCIDQINDAFAAMLRGDVARGVIRFG